MPEYQQTKKTSEAKSNIQKQTTLPKHIPSSHPAAIIQRARIDPKSLTHADVMQLQRTIGNRAVGRLLSEIGLIPSKVTPAPPVQMQKIPEEEETLQGKMVETIQRQEIPEEEEPLQGKMIKSIQRQEIPEEEEPLQGKFESGHDKEIRLSCIQRQEIPEEEEPLQGKMGETIQLQEIPEEEPLQGKFESIQRQGIQDEEPLQIKRANNTGMPDSLKAGVENLSGIDMSNVRVHYNSNKPAEVGALAYTQGTDIHVAPGQERHLPHEAWHVVQQAQGRVRPTLQMRNLIVNDDKELEHEADMMGSRAVVDQKGMNTKQISNFSQTKLVQMQKIIQCGKDQSAHGTLQITNEKVNSNPELRDLILHFIKNFNNNSPSFKREYTFILFGGKWSCKLRVDLAGEKHGEIGTPHIQFSDVYREFEVKGELKKLPQKVEDLRIATDLEIKMITILGFMPPSITYWAATVLSEKEKNIQSKGKTPTFKL